MQIFDVADTAYLRATSIYAHVCRLICTVQRGKKATVNQELLRMTLFKTQICILHVIPRKSTIRVAHRMYLQDSLTPEVVS
jgi:hypothetical protein